VESRIVYLPLYPDADGVVWNEDFLNRSPNALEQLSPEYADLDPAVRVIHVPEVADGLRLHVVMDSEEDRALAYLAPPT
jgi:hypothetical protein